MQKKIIGILIMILFISSSFFPITGIVESDRVNNLNSDFANKYAWSGKGHGLDNKGVISVIVPSSYPVYLVFSTRYEIFSPDSGHVELSADSGANWYPMDSITGVQSDWTMRSVDISSFMGMPVLIRFRYSTGSYSTSEGWYVDSISINGNVVEDFEGYNAGDYWGDWVIVEKAGNLPPTVGITFPKNGDVVNGTVIITGEAHDPNGDYELKWVMLKIGDFDWSYADGTSSWSYVWDTTIVNDGSCLISAITTDGSLQSTVFTIVVIVDNIEGPDVQPDLVITDIWDENNLIYYQIRNIGDDNASSGHYTSLFVDNENKASDLVEKVLAPGERFNSHFDYSWDCTGLEVLVSAYADYNDIIIESNETNNKREEKWKCDTTSPKIIDGPSVQGVSQSSATIYWKTDEFCDSIVSFDRYAGEYNDIVRDSKLVNVHNIVLNGLMSGTVYHFMVESMDASGNSVKSRDYYFATTKAADNKKPSLYPHTPDILSGIVDISIDASDNVGVDRVHFSCDDEPIFTMYSPPYDFGFYTGGLMDGEHDFGFDVVDSAGNVESETLRGNVVNRYPPEESPLNVHIVNPIEGGEYIIRDQIHIIALVESEIDTCLDGYQIILDEELFNPLWSEDFECPPWLEIVNPEVLEYYRGGIYEHYIGEDKFWWVDYWWNTSNYEPDGVTRIDVNAWDNYGNVANDWIEFEIIIPPPEIQVFRDVERIGNYYEIELTIRNNGVVPVKGFEIYDTHVGFQCYDELTIDPSISLPPGSVNVIGGTSTYNSVNNSYSKGEYSEILILIPSSFILDGGEELHISYYAVPVLYIPTATVRIDKLDWIDGTQIIKVPNVIGQFLKIRYQDNNYNIYSIQKDDLKYDLTNNDDHSCVDDVSYAFGIADYLLVTSPEKLNIVNPLSAKNINELLSTMAKLAKIKNGVLGYFDSNTISSSTRAAELRSLIRSGGNWWNKLCPLIDRGLPGLFFYLLIVGEEEIIPSYYTATVNCTDYYFSDIISDDKPDLSVGRIIGNTSLDLIKPLKASIGVQEDPLYFHFDRSHALLVSGKEPGQSDFVQDVNDIEDILKPETVVKKIHWKDYYNNYSFIWDYQEHDGFAVGDVRGDDKEEIIIADRSDDHIYILDEEGNNIGGFDKDFAEGDGFAVGELFDGLKDYIVFADYDENRISIYNGIGQFYDSFEFGFQQFDEIAVGDVMGDNDSEIIIADRSDNRIHVYDSDGSRLRRMNIPDGYSLHDGFAVGNVGEDNKEDILIADRSRDVIYVYDTNYENPDEMRYIGYILKTFDEGDTLAVGLNPGGKESIIIGDLSSDKIYAYNINSGGEDYRKTIGIDCDIGRFDGLAVGDIDACGVDEIIIGDRDDFIRVFKPYDYSRMLDIFKSNTIQKDIILFRDHGNLDRWSPALSTGDFPLDFGATCPFVFAIACLTGNYEDDDDYNIAEAFFDSGAAVYIGATEVSYRSLNSPAGKWFFDHWDASETIGEAFTNLERHYWNEGDGWKEWVRYYNIYGDPKFGNIELFAYDSSSYTTTVFEQNPKSSIDIVIPDYKVTTYDELDYVDIPGGEILIEEEGRPKVPYYIYTIEYPQGYQIQDVVLNKRSGLTSTIGLELPLVVLNEKNETHQVKEGWYPSYDYTWRIDENNDGNTILIITIYPFYYNPDTTMVKFYKNYNFDIEYVYNNVKITGLYTDKIIYKPGDAVKMDLWFENPGETQDFILNLIVKHDVSEKVVDGLFIRSLNDLKGIGSYSVTLDSLNNLSSGSYYIEASIIDTFGNVLDAQYEKIYFETPSLEIKSISGGFGTSAVIENTGKENLTDLKWSINIDGNMVFFGRYKEGNIAIIEVDETYRIKSGLIIGFGPAEITVNVAGIGKTISCFLLGPFVLNIKEI